MNKLRDSRWTVICGFLLAAICLLAIKTYGQETANNSRPRNPAFALVTDDPKLPRVLLIGDSISIGYTVPVRELLAGQANVHRPLTNCGPTTRGLEQLDGWLGEEKWDVIHFNFGLHDLKYIDPLEFWWHAPLTAIEGSKKCPGSGAPMEASWTWCPWNGKRPE